MNYVFCFLEIFAIEGGIQSYVKDILQALALATTHRLDQQISRIEADLLFLRDTGGDHSLNQFPQLTFHYLATRPPWLGRLKLATTLLQLLIFKRPQRVFCGHINLAPLVHLLCQPLGIPYTVFTYGKEVWEPLAPQYQTALQQADRIWTISRYSRDRACQVNQLDPAKFDLVPCMINGEQFTPGTPPQYLIERYQLEDYQVLITVARLWATDIYKGVDVTIRALPLILKHFPQVKYLVIGRGDDQPRLARLAAELGVGEQVIFAGFVPTAELVDYYRLADAYVMPSQEGFGIVYLEAMACGVPVVSGNEDGSAEPLQDGTLGWRVPYRDVEAVAQACVEILQGKDQRCDGEWLRQQALAEFGRDVFNGRVQQLLRFTR